MTQKWYVLQVLSGKEKKVKKTIEDQREQHGMVEDITEVLVPTEKVSEIKQGEQRVVEKKLWPGYILVKMMLTDDSWQYIKGCNGVVDFLGGGSPTALTDGEVTEILEDLKSKRETVTQKHQFKLGDNVKIIDGVFINFIGTITKVDYDKGKMGVLVSIFGRDTQVDDLDFSQVEEITDESEMI